MKGLHHLLLKVARIKEEDAMQKGTGRKRFFETQLELPPNDSSFPFERSLQNDASFLFSNNDDSVPPEEVTPSSQQEERTDKNGFIKQLREILPEATQMELDRLAEMFCNAPNGLERAIDHYFSDADDRLVVDLSQCADDGTSQRISSVHRSKSQQVPHILSQKRRSSIHVSSPPKRMTVKTPIKWKKFIGSLQVNAMITRPTVRPLKYGTNLKLRKSGHLDSVPEKLPISGISNKNHTGTLVRVVDPKTDREIGRLPENIGKFVYPLLGTDAVYFSATLIYCGERRLGVGDSFIIQLDCFLTSKLFEEDNFSNTSHNKLYGVPSRHDTVRHGSYLKRSMDETTEESLSRLRGMAFSGLFHELRLRPIIPGQETSKQDDEEPMIVDLEDPEVLDGNVLCNRVPHQDGGDSYNGGQSDTMNLLQLKDFYNSTQATEYMKNLEETEPPSDIVGLTLRRYQKQGLTWMLRREQEYGKIAGATGEEHNNELMNPLWRQYRWPKDMSWKSQRSEESLRTEGDPPFDNEPFFFANLYSCEFSLVRPVVKSKTKGGILSDEMGLGKTISMLSLILTVPYDSDYVEPKRSLFGVADDIEKNDDDDDDIKIINPPLQRDVPYAAKTTLIVVPMSLLNQWNSEFEKINKCSTFYSEFYYGGNVSSIKTLLTNTKNPPVVVLTTYGIVQNEWSRLMKAKEANADTTPSSGLFSIKFHRIVLDEGHTIRNRSTATFKAVMSLNGTCKWILTGTPVINRLDDLFSLVKFLHLEPWCRVSYWKQFISTPFENKDFKQAFDVANAILQPVLLRRTKQMRDVDGTPLVELPPKEIIVERLKFGEYQHEVYRQFLGRAEDSVKSALIRCDLLKKYSTILVNILRLRQICCDVSLLGSPDENDEDISSSYAYLRDSSDVNSLLEKAGGDKVSGFSEDEFKEIKENIREKFIDAGILHSLECAICTTESINLENVLFTECGHPFCGECLTEYIKFQKQKDLELRCPLCRELIHSNKLLSLARKADGNFDLLYYNNVVKSAKLVALINHLQTIQDTLPGEQVVVFSQFSSYLDILERELTKTLPVEDTQIFKFDGRLNLKDRGLILKEFQVKDPAKQKILLLSLKAGGVGLNLTCASHAFLMDPWWSPSMEDQAIDRIHRIGQLNQVKVVRFIIEDSIEEKMLRIQERKRTIGETMDINEDERRKRRIEEIKMLFE